MNFTIRPITPADDAAMANMIRTVLHEFGCVGEGFAIHDPEVDWLSRAYPGGDARYFVVECDGVVAGGGGFGRLAGTTPDEAICELRKMYFVPALRGLGAGRALIAHLLAEMRAAGYRRCYLETTTAMSAARRLYIAAGFTESCSPLGATGHHACDRFFVRDL